MPLSSNNKGKAGKGWLELPHILLQRHFSAHEEELP